MKIIQSYWTHPTTRAKIKDGRFSGGWLSSRYHYMGLSLSCLLLKKFHPQVELITDAAGADLLVDKLELPYTKVDTSLDAIHGSPHALWALPKIYAYNKQTEPFLHVDGDVFIWKCLLDFVEEDDLIVQSPEYYMANMYRRKFKHLNDVYQHIPAELVCKKNMPASYFHSVNAGVLGGRDIEFINMYSSEILKFIDDNQYTLDKDINAASLNVILEQLFFAKLAASHNKKIGYIIPKLSRKFDEMLQSYTIPMLHQYLHLAGNAKKVPLNCEQIEYRLRYEFPREYCKIVKTIEQLSKKNNNNYHPQSAFFTHRNRIKVQNLLNESITMDNEHEDKKLFAKQLAVLEQSLHKVAKSIKNYTTYRFNNVKIYYSLLSKLSISTILNQPLTTSRNFIVLESNWSTKEFNYVLSKHATPAPSVSIKYLGISSDCVSISANELKGLDILLSLFQNRVLSGKEFIDDVIKNNILGISINKEEFELLIFPWLMYHLVYTGHLKMCNRYAKRQKRGYHYQRDKGL